MHAEFIKKAAAYWGRQTHRLLKWCLLVLVVVIFVLLIYPGLNGSRNEYQLGDIADHDMKAPHDFFVEDPAATETNRQLAVEKVLTIYDYDPRISQQIGEKIRKAFGVMRDKLAQIETAPKSTAPVDDAQPDPLSTHQTAPDPQERDKVLAAFRDDFANTMGIAIDRGAFRLLTTDGFSAALAELIVRIVIDIMANGVVANKEVLLKEAEKGIVLRNVATQTEQTVYSLRQYYGPDQAKTMVRIVAEPLVKDLSYNKINLIVDYCQNLIQPNITLNRNETEKRKTLAVDSIKPIMYKIKAGEMVLREGERITSVHLLKLNELNRQVDTRRFSTVGFGAAVMVAALLITSYLLYFAHPRHSRKNTPKNLIFLSISLVLVFVLTKIAAGIQPSQATDAFSVTSLAILYAMPIAAAPMMICLVLGFEISLLFSMVSALSAALLFGGRLEILFFLVINQTMAAFWVQNCRERKIMGLAGLKLGLLNIFLILIVGLFTAERIGWQLLSDALFGFSGGIGSSIITLGLAPLVEMAFGYTTDITLPELANLDRPLLRRLMIEAPGTYHHSMIVGSLVEAAASEIGANPLLAKVCAYYHDIGKVKKPLYFIENQTGGRNKHDKLAPSMSSLILIAHIKDGVEIAQKNKLGQNIIDTIQQHHGTSLISYFYEKAKQLKGENAVKIDDFRYPGPMPQTKETGLVMLADVVEAASRTLENPTPARIQGLVQHLINKVFSDGQLDNCELTLKDLHSIARSFNTILYGIHHHRIEYTESSGKDPKDNNKVRDGNFNRQPAGKIPLRDLKNSKESPGHLKRLGLS